MTKGENPQAWRQHLKKFKICAKILEKAKKDSVKVCKSSSMETLCGNGRSCSKMKAFVARNGEKTYQKNVVYKGRCQKLLSRFCPLRGGVPPLSAKLF